MPFGYHGKILHVNLTTGQIATEEPPPDFYRTYMGGSALALTYLLQGMAANADPLGADNILVIALSVLTGTPIHGQSRATVTAKSPLTNAIGDSQAGGYFPAELKFAGWDAIVIRGANNRPVYLWLHEGEAELLPADDLWGTDTLECWQRIQAAHHDKNIEVACIGQAGENLVRFASIMTMANRAFGRTGMGAVMGSKQLKAIAVQGTRYPNIADPNALKTIALAGRDEIKQTFDRDFGKYGTAGSVSAQEFNGGLPTRNYAEGSFVDASTLSGEKLYDEHLKRRDTCYACAVKCKRVVEIQASEFGSVNPAFGGPEYETIATFGSYCEVNSLAAVSKANEMCNRWGMDTISAGATIAWAMEAYEWGMLPQAEEDEIALRFRDGHAMLRALEAIAFRRGELGDLLAEGSERAATALKNGSEAFLTTVKGQEAPAHMPQVKRSLGLIYAVNPFGADHQSSSHDDGYTPGIGRKQRERLATLGLTSPQESNALTPEKVEFALTTQYFFSLMDTLGLCQFDWGPTWELYGPAQLIEVVNAITGWNTTLEELMTVGRRRLNLLRAFNAREGLGRDADRLPKRLYKTLTKGASKGDSFTEAEIEQAKSWYYALAGWDVQSGIPTSATLSDIGLEWVTPLLFGQSDTDSEKGSGIL